MLEATASVRGKGFTTTPVVSPVTILVRIFFRGFQQGKVSRWKSDSRSSLLRPFASGVSVESSEGHPFVPWVLEEAGAVEGRAKGPVQCGSRGSV